MAYSEDTAGSMITTDFIEISSHQTVGEALETVKKSAHEIEAIYYVYVHDDEGKLTGVLSWRHLMTTDPALQLGNIAQPRLVTLSLKADMNEIADTFLRYNFLYLPVVDESGVLVGVISFKHAFDQLLPHLYRVWKQD